LSQARAGPRGRGPRVRGPRFESDEGPHRGADLRRAERYAEVLVDIGIADQIDGRVWRQTIEDLIAALREGGAAEGLATAVSRVGEILAEHAPPTRDPADELPNKVILV
jgi:putative membrane protein